jgi:predicted Fe-Mo cluster-binding NifX family protein
MKIAVSSTGPTSNDTVDPHFGRCTYFLLFDPVTMACEALPNPSLDSGGGAGIQAATFLIERGVSVVITGKLGPNALHVLKEAEIHTVTGVDGPALQAVHKFTSGSLAGHPSVQAGRVATPKTRRGMGGGRATGPKERDG